MAVAYVSDVEGIWSSGTTMTLSSVGGSGGNLVVVFVTWRRNSSQNVTGVTYGGNAMTQIGSMVESTTGGAIVAYYYVTSSDGNVVATWDVDPANAQATALVFSGAHASTPIGTHATSAPASSTSTSTAAVTSETDGMCVDGLALRTSSVGLACDGAQTQRSAQELGDSLYHRTSTEPGAASVTMSWSWTNSNSYAHIVVPIAPAADGSSLPIFQAYYRMLQNA